MSTLVLLRLGHRKGEYLTRGACRLRGASEALAGCGGSDGGSKPSLDEAIDTLETRNPDFVTLACQAIANGQSTMLMAGIKAAYSSPTPADFPAPREIYEEVATRC